MKSLAFIAIIILLSFAANGQCAMCTKTAQGLGSDAGKGINNAIIYLALIPFSMILGVFYYMYRSHRQEN
jgi:hypothetical protein